MAGKQKRLVAESSDPHEVFRAIIDQSGLTRYEIAKRLGVTESALGRPYNGQRGVSWELLQRVAEVAGMQVTARAEAAGSAGE